MEICKIILILEDFLLEMFNKILKDKILRTKTKEEEMILMTLDLVILIIKMLFKILEGKRMIIKEMQEIAKMNGTFNYFNY